MFKTVKRFSKVSEDCSAYFIFHELPSFSQSLLGGNLANCSRYKNRTDALQKMSQNKYIFGHIRVFHIFYRDLQILISL